MRKAFIDTVTELARENSDVMVIIGDTGFSVFEEFEQEFQERFVNVGIAEQNFISFGAGLAAMGMKPFVYNVVSFMTLRALEEIMLDVCYQENPTILVGVGGGFAYAQAGPTHHACQDIATMTMLPNMTVICPGDPNEMKEAVRAAYAYNKPVYIRIGRNSDPVVHLKQIDFQIGKAIRLYDGNDIALFATGTMLKDAEVVYQSLKDAGIGAELYSMHTIKPIDETTILDCMKRHKAIFTIEEHSVIGGLGAAVSSVLIKYMSKYNTVFKSYGIPDEFALVTGSREYLNQLYELDSKSITKDIIKVWGNIL